MLTSSRSNYLSPVDWIGKIHQSSLSDSDLYMQDDNVGFSELTEEVLWKKLEKALKLMGKYVVTHDI